jgi:hypothetical protein
MIAKHLIALLTGNFPVLDPLRGPIQNQIVALVNNRVQLNKLDEATIGQVVYPYLIVHQISGKHVMHLQGRAGMAQPHLGITAYALKGGDANNLGDLVRQFLDGYKDLPNLPPPAILGCFLMDEGDDYLPPAHWDEVGVHATPWNFLVVHSEN